MQSLPGIGRYTAGAILSFAFDRPAPILEANSRRVLRRLLAAPGRPKNTSDSLLWEYAERLVPRQQAGVFNQALMELGSLVCLIRDPQCRACPVRDYCNAHVLGIQDELAGTSAAPRTTAVHELAIVLRRRGAVLLLRRAEGGRWAGMWDFPRVDVTQQVARAERRSHPIPSPDRVEDSVRRLLGLPIRLGSHFLRLRHSVTRFRVTVDCFFAEAVAAEGPPPNVKPLEPGWSDATWLEPSALEQIPLSSPGRRIAAALLTHGGTNDGDKPRRHAVSPRRRK